MHRLNELFTLALGAAVERDLSRVSNLHSITG